jgi:hypothetical protein
MGQVTWRIICFAAYASDIVLSLPAVISGCRIIANLGGVLRLLLCTAIQSQQRIEWAPARYTSDEWY